MIWPGLAVDATADGATDAAGADAAGADAPPEGGPAEAGEPPHAPTTSATTEARAPNRFNPVLPIPLLLSLSQRHSQRLKRRACPWSGRAPVAQFFPVGSPPLDCLTMSSVSRTTRRSTRSCDSIVWSNTLTS